MALIAESGVDKDSYLAALIDGYEKEIDQLKRDIDDAHSVQLAAQLDAQERHDVEIAALKRQLANAQSAHTVRGMQQGATGAGPMAGTAAAAAAAGVLPVLVVAGEVSAEESEALLRDPCPPSLPVDAARARADKLRLLANVARHELAQLKVNEVLMLQQLAVYRRTMAEMGVKVPAITRP
jgi:hypothetical protein